MKQTLILDTDIGDDIDDLWALSLILNSKKFDLKLITLSMGDFDYKYKVVSKFLQIAGRSDVKIAYGREVNSSNMPHTDFIKDFNPINNRLCCEATRAIAEVAERNENTLIVAIGPLTNIGDYTVKYPKSRVKIVAMGGAFRQGYINENEPKAEFNVLMDSNSFNEVCKNALDFTLCPLDVCRSFKIENDDFKVLKVSEDSVIKQLLQLYYDWQISYSGGAIKYDSVVSSSILYDILPIMYVLSPEEFCGEKVPLTALKDGSTVVDEKANKINVLTALKNQDSLIKKTVEFLTKNK